MRATLEVMSGLLLGRRFDLRPGPAVVFGRSEEAGVCLPHDPELADRHFEVQCGDAECRLRALSGATVYVDGKKVADAELQAGARITAGRTTLIAVKVEETPGRGGEGRPPRGAAAAGAAAPKAKQEQPPAPERTGPELLAWLGVEEEVQAVAAPGQPGKELVDLLQKSGHHAEAVRVQAHLLGPRKAVWWGCLGLKEVLGTVSGKDAAPYEAAKLWAADPTEEHRRVAEEAANAVEHEGTASWLAMAAFWSGGSIAPAEYAEVPPDERLCGQGVTGALMLAATIDPAKAVDRYKAFLKLARAIEKGEHPFPAPARA